MRDSKISEARKIHRLREGGGCIWLRHEHHCGCESVSEPFINISALEPLFAPHEEPNRHRVRADKEGQPARIVTGRRRTPIAIAQNLRPLRQSLARQ